MISKKLKNKLLETNVDKKYNVLVNRCLKENNLNLQDIDGNTLLHYNIFNVNNEIIELLLLNKANPNICNNQKLYPLHCALERQYRSTILLLIKYGADVYLEDYSLNTPIKILINSIYDRFNFYYNNIHIISELDEKIDVIISDLDMLKEFGIFSDINYQGDVEKIYKISYEFMKLEVLFNKNKLLLYFKDSFYDYNYINEFISKEIEELLLSINYIDGVNELKQSILNRNENSNYMDEELIRKLAICSFPDIMSRVNYVYKKLNELNKEINRIFSIVKEYKNMETFSSSMLFHNVKLTYEDIKREYKELMKNNSDYLILDANKENNKLIKKIGAFDICILT